MTASTPGRTSISRSVAIHSDDGVDPTEFFRPTRKPNSSRRKAQQARALVARVHSIHERENTSRKRSSKKHMHRCVANEKSIREMTAREPGPAWATKRVLAASWRAGSPHRRTIAEQGSHRRSPVVRSASFKDPDTHHEVRGRHGLARASIPPMSPPERDQQSLRSSHS